MEENKTFLCTEGLEMMEKARHVPLDFYYGIPFHYRRIGAR